MHLFLLLALLQDGVIPSADPIAFERIRALAPKQTYRTAEFEWTMSAHGDINDGLVERFRTHIVGESILQSNFGDARGFHEYEQRGHIPDGATHEQIERATYPREKSAGTRNTLRHENLVWDLPAVEKPVGGTFGHDGFPQLRSPVDPLIAGLSPAWDRYASNRLNAPIHTYAGLEAAELRSGRDGGFRTVTAEHGGKTWTWWFDDRRGGQPVRAMMRWENGNAVHSETELMQVDGRWLPRSIRFYRSSSDHPYRIMEFKSASFDQPWHRQTLSVADLGAKYGTQFNDYTITDLENEEPFKFWDGEGLMDGDEFWMTLHGFGILFDDAVLEGRAASQGITKEQLVRQITVGEHAERSRAHYRAKYVALYREDPPWITTAKGKEKDEWDLFVEQFVEKHDLSDKAAERAEKILEAAKKLRSANRFRLKNAERENERRLIDRYKDREELIYKERLVAPLEDLAKSGAAKKEEDKEEGR